VSALGDLAEALIEAPRCRTLHLRGRTHTDLDVLARSWDDVEGEGHTVRLFGQGPPVPPDDRAELWLDNGDPPRWRSRHGASVSVCDGPSAYVAWGTDVLRQERPRASSPDAWRPVLDGATLFASFRFARPSAGEAVGRPVWRTGGTRRLVPHMMMWEGHLQGDRVELSVDQATGVVLHYRTFHRDEVLSELELVEVDVDPVLADELFVPDVPDGGRVLSREELVAEHDVIRMHRPTVEELVAGHHAFGPPPEDEDTARADVTEAVEHQFHRSEDGADLPWVSDGEGVGTHVGDAQRRFGFDEPATVEVLGIAFDDDRQATVWFSVSIDGGRSLILPQVNGRALLTPDGWRVARATVVDLLARSGIHVPPPESPEDPGDRSVG
jgi:hypothetical protein